MKNKSKESKYPYINCDFGKRWGLLTIKGFEGDLVFFMTSAGNFITKYCNLSFYVFICDQGKRNEKLIPLDIYIYIYIYFYNGSFGSEHTNKYKNNKDCTLL